MGAARPICDGLFVADDAEPRLVAGRCGSCSELHFPASDICPYCGDAATPAPIGPHGTVRLFTVVRTSPPGYRGPIPYGFGAVEIDGTGLAVLSRLDEADVTRLRPGRRVRLRIAPLFTDDDGCPVLSWSFAAEDS
jgi:uncharacterized OB-fold protein